MRIWRASERVFDAWKNGGGRTATLASHPEAAGPGGFDWRISTALIDRSGPFSEFPGCTRLFTVIAGGPVTLRLGGGREETRRPGDAPLAFSGDISCDCLHTGAPTLALNVMARAPWRAAVGPQPHAGAVRAFLFALEDLPDHGLAARDLAETDAPVPGDALHIALLR